MKDRFGFDWTKLQGTPYWKKPQLERRMFFRHVASAVGGYMLLPGGPMESVASAAVKTKGTAKWLESVVRGYFRYHAVPCNEERLKAFRHEVLRMWWRQLRRRSQRSRWTWDKFQEKLGSLLPEVEILWPYPNVRFAWKHPHLR